MAFVAGVVSFLSPCVLPLVPGYLSYVSGISFEELAAAQGKATLVRRAMIHALVFSLGFTTIFVALGASATAIGQFLLPRLGLFTKIGGVIVILLGLHIMGIWKIGLLYREKRLTQTHPKKGLIGSYITGLAFAFAWTPCVGPILGAILTLAATREAVNDGVMLLSVYSLGLALPFLLTALATQAFLTLFHRLKGYLRTIEVGAGFLVVVMGLLMLTNNLTWISGKLTFLNRFVW